MIFSLAAAILTSSLDADLKSQLFEEEEVKFSDHFIVILTSTTPRSISANSIPNISVPSSHPQKSSLVVSSKLSNPAYKRSRVSLLSTTTGAASQKSLTSSPSIELSKLPTPRLPVNYDCQNRLYAYLPTFDVVSSYASTLAHALSEEIELNFSSCMKSMERKFYSNYLKVDPNIFPRYLEPTQPHLPPPSKLRLLNSDLVADNMRNLGIFFLRSVEGNSQNCSM